MNNVFQKEINLDLVINASYKFKILLITAILILLILVTYFFDFRRQEYQYQKSKTDELTLQKNLINKQKSVASLKIYQQQLEVLQKQYHYMLQFLIEPNDVPVFFAQAEEFAKQDHVLIQQVQPLPETKQGFFAERSFRIILSGSYHSLAQLLTQLVNSDCLIDIDHFILTTKNTRDENIDDEKLQMDLVIKIYLHSA